MTRRRVQAGLDAGATIDEANTIHLMEIDPMGEARESHSAAVANAKRDGQRVVVENVSRPEGLNSVLASLTSALRAQGEDVT